MYIVQKAEDYLMKKSGKIRGKQSEDVADAIIQFREMGLEQYRLFCINARKTAEEYDYKNLVKVLIEKIEE